MTDIKPNELRIGNYIKHGGAVVIVEEVLKEGAMVKFLPNQTGNMFDGMKPIPITEEWLIRFGFKIRSNPNNPDNSFFWDNGEVKMIQSDKLYCSDIVSTIEIKHVHQLQNLYFALTGEELHDKYN